MIFASSANENKLNAEEKRQQSSAMMPENVKEKNVEFRSNVLKSNSNDGDGPSR
jgi:hypothetical protein